MDDARSARVEIFEPTGDAQHDLEHRQERRMRHATDVIKQIAICAQLCHDHDRHGTERLLRNRHANEVNNVWMTKISKQAELFDVHVGEVTSNVGDRDDLLPVHALVYVLHSQTTGQSPQLLCAPGALFSP